ncbi:MAG TPA: type II toxin-antitoxin system RelE/ParE family toxin [Xanthomonadaceae bacterium]|nr:type II toxin-antitoxin system RelE/ParE family toxin [Xanthomonadaceae bacterium]
MPGAADAIISSWPPAPVLADVAHIRNYIAADSRRYAARWVEHVFEAAESLAPFPEQGRLVPKAAPRQDIRELIVQGL